MLEPLRVDPALLRQTASRLGEVAGSLRNIDVGSFLSGAASSLANLDTGAALRQISPDVAAQFTQYRTAITQYAEKLTKAASAYEEGDGQQARKIDETMPTDTPADNPKQTDDGSYTPLTAAQLQAIVPTLSDARAQEIIGPLNDTMRQGGMNTPKRQAAFISQVAVESDHFNTFEEYASGAAYNGRTDLGNTQPGDGPRYKGRGAIQVTGRYNYTKMSQDLGVDFVNHPELAATPQYAFRTALWYWDTHNGNAIADQGNIVSITEMVNGGTTALPQRTEYYNRALQVLGR